MAEQIIDLTADSDDDTASPASSLSLTDAARGANVSLMQVMDRAVGAVSGLITGLKRRLSGGIGGENVKSSGHGGSEVEVVEIIDLDSEEEPVQERNSHQQRSHPASRSPSMMADIKDGKLKWLLQQRDHHRDARTHEPARPRQGSGAFAPAPFRGIVHSAAIRQTEPLVMAGVAQESPENQRAGAAAQHVEQSAQRRPAVERTGKDRAPREPNTCDLLAPEAQQAVKDALTRREPEALQASFRSALLAKTVPSASTVALLSQEMLRTGEASQKRFALAVACQVRPCSSATQQSITLNRIRAALRYAL